MTDKQKVTILLSILGILLIGIGVEIIFMGGNRNKTETKEPNNIINTDTNKEENNEQKTDIENETVNNENINNQNNDITYIKDDVDVSEKKSNNTVGGLKIDIDYSETFYYDMNDNQIDKPSEDDDIDYEYETVTIRLLGTGQYIKSYGTVAGYKDYGTYSINNNILTLTRKYTAGSDCKVIENKGTEKYTVKNNTIVINNKKILKENKEGKLRISGDICSYNEENPLNFEYNNENINISLELLPFNYYMLGYCNDGNCGISFGTYKEVKNEIVFNQKIYQAQDSCYYSQTKQYKGTYTDDNLDCGRENCSTITIDLSNTTDINMKNKQYKLVNTDDDILSKLWDQPLFKSYCGKL